MKRWSALALCAAAFAAGCGGEDEPDSGSGGGGQELTTVRVVGAPTVASAPLYLGMKQGFFEDEGLKVEPTMAENNAAITAAVVSGDALIGAGTLDGSIQAVGNGVPIKVVAPINVNPVPKSDTSNNTSHTILVKEDGPLREPKDLEGKTVAVSALGGIFELIVRATAERHGLDADAIKFRVLPFAEAVQAVNAGRIDAAVGVEPFTTMATREGARRLLNLYPFDPEEQPVWLSGVYYTSNQSLGSDRDVIDRFVRAAKKTNAYIQENPKALRDIIPTFTDIDESVAAAMVMPGFPTELDRGSAESLADAMVETGVIEEAPSIDEVLAPAGGE